MLRNELRRSKREDAEGLTRPGRKVRRISIIIMNIEWLRLCRRPLLSTYAISYCLLVTSERCLEGGRDRNGTPADFVFISYELLFTKGSPMFSGY